MKKAKANSKPSNPANTPERRSGNTRAHYTVRAPGPVRRHDPFGVIDSDRYLDERSDGCGW